MPSDRAARKMTLVVGLSLAALAACDADDPGDATDGSDGFTQVEAERRSGVDRPPPPGWDDNPVRLQEDGPVIIPGLRDGTEWFGAVRVLRIDPGTGHLLTLDRHGGRVAEFTPSGKLIRQYGGPGGQGPREVRRATSFTFSDSVLFLLDRGNRKVLVYDRDTGYRASFPVQPWHKSIALSGERLFLLPGSGGFALDVYSTEGEELGNVGDAASLPAGESDSTVSDQLDRPICGGCQLLALRSETLLAAGTEAAVLVQYSEEGEVLRRIDLFEENALLSHWRAEDEDHLRTLQVKARERSTSSHQVRVLKRYVHGFSLDTRGRVGVTAIPSRDVLEARGYEYWSFDPDDFSYQRYRYPRRKVGYLAVGDGRSIYALDTNDSGIYRFRRIP